MFACYCGVMFLFSVSSQVSAQENRNISINKQNVPFEEIVGRSKHRLTIHSCIVRKRYRV